MKTLSAQTLKVTFILAFIGVCSIPYINAQDSQLDKKVEAFLENHKREWRDMNVPASDGKLLYDIILKNGLYQRTRNWDINGAFNNMDRMGLQ